MCFRGNKQLKYVAAFICVLLLSSWLATFILAIKHNFVAKVQEPFALFDELYDKPWMRIGPYLIGMIIGVLKNSTGNSFENLWLIYAFQDTYYLS